jgi:TRAP transporter TAXI family solute receptor
MLKRMTVLVITAVLVFSGCSKSENASNQAASGGAKAPVSITLGTAGTAGTYYIVAAAMAQTVNKFSDFLTVTAQSTKGSVENINLCNTGDIEMGMSNSDGVYWATTGTGTFDGNPQNISRVMAL